MSFSIGMTPKKSAHVVLRIQAEQSALKQSIEKNFNAISERMAALADVGNKDSTQLVDGYFRGLKLLAMVTLTIHHEDPPKISCLMLVEIFLSD